MRLFDRPREYDGAVSGGVLRLLEVGAPLEEEGVGGTAQVEVHGEAPPVRGQDPRQLQDDEPRLDGRLPTVVYSLEWMDGNDLGCRFKSPSQYHIPDSKGYL